MHLTSTDEEDILLYGEVIDVCKKEKLSSLQKMATELDASQFADSAVG